MEKILSFADSRYIPYIQVIGISLIIFVLYVYYQTEVRPGIIKEREERSQRDAKLTCGPYPIPIWERIIQILLIFLTSVYAAWSLGFQRLIDEQSEFFPLLATLILASVMIFVYYMIILLPNKKLIDSSLTSQTMQSRMQSYLKLLLSNILISVIRYLFK